MGVENVRSEVWRNRFVLRDAGLAVLVIGTFALVVTVVTRGDGATATLVTGSTPAPLLSPDEPLEESLEPLPSDSPSPAAVPSPTLVARPTVTVTPRPSPTPAPSRTPSDRPTPRPTSASPRPPSPGYPGPGLRLDVTAKSAGSLVGQTTVRVRDTDGTWNGGFITFGDGERQDFGRTAPRCSGTSAPGDATPSDVSRTFRHTYDAAGSYDVVVFVRTERFCSNAPVEDTSKTVRVRITPASSSPQPTASPEPTPDPTPQGSSAPRPR